MGVVEGEIVTTVVSALVVNIALNDVATSVVVWFPGADELNAWEPEVAALPVAFTVIVPVSSTFPTLKKMRVKVEPMLVISSVCAPLERSLALNSGY